MSEPELPDSAQPHPVQTAQLTSIPGLPWLWLTALGLLLLFTPLGKLWPLVWVVVGAGVLLRVLSSVHALAWAVVAVLAGTFTAGNWAGFAPSLDLRNDAGEALPEQNLSLEGIRKLELRSFNGGIRVIAGASAKLIVRRKGDVAVNITTQDDRMSILAKKPFFSWNTGASLELSLPTPLLTKPALELSASSSNGPIEIAAKLASLTLESSNGRIVISGTQAEQTKIQASNSAIEINQFSGALKAITSNAPIRLRNASNTSFSLETANGPITLEQVGLQANSHSSAQTANGAINLVGLGASAGLSIKGSTSNASIDVKLPALTLKLENDHFEANSAGLGVAELELSTSNARIVARP